MQMLNCKLRSANLVSDRLKLKMKRVFTKSRGVSNGLGNGDSPKDARMYEAWRASTDKMVPAAVK